MIMVDHTSERWTQEWKVGRSFREGFWNVLFYQVRYCQGDGPCIGTVRYDVVQLVLCGMSQ